VIDIEYDSPGPAAVQKHTIIHTSEPEKLAGQPAFRTAPPAASQPDVPATLTTRPESNRW